MRKLWVSTFEKGIIGGEDGGPAAIFSPKSLSCESPEGCKMVFSRILDR
jgi:hypothetical protein